MSNSPVTGDLLTHMIKVLHGTQKWDLCVIFPHVKDPYYLAYTHGSVTEDPENHPDQIEKLP